MTRLNQFVCRQFRSQFCESFIAAELRIWLLEVIVPWCLFVPTEERGWWTCGCFLLGSVLCTQTHMWKIISGKCLKQHRTHIAENTKEHFLQSHLLRTKTLIFVQGIYIPVPLQSWTGTLTQPVTKLTSSWGSGCRWKQLGTQPLSLYPSRCSCPLDSCSNSRRRGPVAKLKTLQKTRELSVRISSSLRHLNPSDSDLQACACINDILASKLRAWVRKSNKMKTKKNPKKNMAVNEETIFFSIFSSGLSNLHQKLICSLNKRKFLKFLSWLFFLWRKTNSPNPAQRIKIQASFLQRLLDLWMFGRPCIPVFSANPKTTPERDFSLFWLIFLYFHNGRILLDFPKFLVVFALFLSKSLSSL